MRRPLRCCVELSINKVTAPGVWLSSRGDIYLSITLFNQYRNTVSHAAVFPINIHEKFKFEKTFYTALDPAEVTDYLDDELIMLELIQFSDYSDGSVRLASYTCNVSEFLYPYPSLSPNYSSTNREILLPRTVAFPGITPKFHFSSRTCIKESLSPEIDAFEDALEDERDLLKHQHASTRRSRSRSRNRMSPSFGTRFSHLTVDDMDIGGTRPPFVVRKLDTDLIGRTPGGATARQSRSRSRGRMYRARSRSLSGGRTPRSLSRGRTGYNYRTILDNKYLSSDDDYGYSSYTPRSRPRSASPVMRRRSLTSRFLDPPYTPVDVSRSIDASIELNKSMERLSNMEHSAAVNRSLERIDRSLENLNRLERSIPSYVPHHYCKYPYTCYRYGCARDDLDLCRYRRYLYY